MCPRHSVREGPEHSEVLDGLREEGAKHTVTTHCARSVHAQRSSEGDFRPGVDELAFLTGCARGGEVWRDS